jgi:hypothetical protein
VIDAPHVFDDFLRDFADAPVAWILDVAPTARARAQAEAIRAWIATHGHALLPDLPRDLPPLWFPLVLLRIADDAAPATGAPPTAHVAHARPDDGIPAAVRCPPLAAAARAAQVDALRRALAEPPPARHRVTAVVCTYRRPAPLARALATLAAQTLAAEAFEVVVVTNDPADATTRETVAALRAERFAHAAERLRLIACPFLGLSYARNLGIGAATAPIVAFLDDDAEAAPDWLARLCDAFDAHPAVGVVGGRITLALPMPRPSWLAPSWERYWSACAASLAAPTVARHWWDFPYGANWSARRQVLLAMGGFRTAFGRTAGDAAGGEELVAAALAERLGHQVLLEPRAQVRHCPDADRFTVSHVWRRIHAAKREELAQQERGYIPPALTLRSTLRSVARRLRDGVLGRAPSTADRIEQLIYASAELRLLPRLARARARGAST